MQQLTDALLAEADDVARRCAELLAHASLPGAVNGATDNALLTLTAVAGRITRLVDTLATRVGGEVAVRSARDAIDPLAKRMGEKTAPLLVAQVADVPLGRAATWCRVGAAITGRRSLTGEPLPVAHEPVAAALAAGIIDADIARVILDTLDEVAPHSTPEKLAGLEAHLITLTSQYPRQELVRLCRRIPERFNPDGVEPREEQLRALAGVKELRPRNGLDRWLIQADPERSAQFRAGLDAHTAPSRQVRFHTDNSTDGDTDGDGGTDTDTGTGTGDPLFDDAVADTRTLAERRLDALVAMATTSLRADQGDLSGIAATVLVTMTQEALVTGIGTATIAGVDTPISASAARRLACDGRIIPIVLGGPSQPLDVGAGRRLFTESQRLAMAIRDQGCIWPGCKEPPNRCQAAHIAPWRWDGPTDIRNGALLCPFHHRRYDNDGWRLEERDGQRWLIPPPWIDARRRPRKAGRPPIPG